jgi:hypothetical protein
MQTHLNALGAPQAAPSHIALGPAAAKRLLGVLMASEWPVRYAGYVIAAVQRKRHPYDEWTDIKLAGNIDTQIQSLKYRAVVQCTQRQTLSLTRTKELVQ